MEETMAALSAAARLHKPRLYAIYGPYLESEDLMVMGWGMHFRTFGRTLYYDPDSAKTHNADNPERLLRLYGRIADVRLDWLDDASYVSSSSDSRQNGDTGPTPDPSG